MNLLTLVSRPTRLGRSFSSNKAARTRWGDQLTACRPQCCRYASSTGKLDYSRRCSTAMKKPSVPCVAGVKSRKD